MFSLLGSNLTLVAVPYQVYRETHSSLWVGLASLVQLPFLITGALWGGAYGDRYDRRVLLMLGSLLCALASTGLALNTLSAHGSLVALLSLAALSAGAGGFTNPIRGAAIPGMLRPDQLISAYSINQIIFNFAAVVGPALAGVLLAAVSLSSCYWIDAVTFLGLVLAAQRMSPLVAPAGREGAALWRAIADGLAYVRQTRWPRRCTWRTSTPTSSACRAPSSPRWPSSSTTAARAPSDCSTPPPPPGRWSWRWSPAGSTASRAGAGRSSW
jgi:MFS family permease